MSHTIVLELSDEDFAAIQRVAATINRTPAEAILDKLRRHGVLDDDDMLRRRAATKAAVDAALSEVAQEMAAKAGQTPDEFIAAWRDDMQAQVSPGGSEEDEKLTLARLQPFCGAVRGGDPRSADNERIDADLAAEYGATHDEDG